MDEQRERGMHRRGFLSGVVWGVTAGGLAGCAQGGRNGGAVAGTESEDDNKRKSLYRESAEVKTYYRVNSYPT